MTAGKVRAALIEQPGVIDVYFEDQIEIVVDDPEAFPLATLEEVLEANDVKLSQVTSVSTKK